MRLLLLLLALASHTNAMDHSGLCSWDELNTKSCTNVYLGNWTWECWCPVLTAPPPPT